MRWILLWIMPLTKDWSLDLLASTTRYHFTTNVSTIWEWKSDAKSDTQKLQMHQEWGHRWKYLVPSGIIHQTKTQYILGQRDLNSSFIVLSYQFTTFTPINANRMNEWCFRPRFCTVNSILGWRQPGRMRWILLYQCKMNKVNWFTVRMEDIFDIGITTLNCEVVYDVSQTGQNVQ